MLDVVFKKISKILIKYYFTDTIIFWQIIASFLYKEKSTNINT